MTNFYLTGSINVPDVDAAFALVARTCSRTCSAFRTANPEIARTGF